MTARSTGAQPAPSAAAGTTSRIARQVSVFHRSFGQPLRTSPTAEVGVDQVGLRLALIEEEVAELRAAAETSELTSIADALADIVYVAYGTAHVYGIDLDAVLDEVHSSNMTKLGADGRPVRRSDGKILKGPGYRAPDVASVLGGRPSVPGARASGVASAAPGPDARTDTSGTAQQAAASDTLES